MAKTKKSAAKANEVPSSLGTVSSGAKGAAVGAAAVPPPGRCSGRSVRAVGAVIGGVAERLPRNGLKGGAAAKGKATRRSASGVKAKKASATAAGAVKAKTAVAKKAKANTGATKKAAAKRKK